MNVAQVNAAEPKLLDRVRREIRTRHLSLRTEEAYVGWVRRFILFHGKRHPAQMGGAEVRAFLTHLAVNGKVAASTQNQALSALLFLYRHVLEQELGTVEDVVRARRPTRLPTVFTQAEVNRVLEAMQGTRALMAGLLYGSGLRLPILPLKLREPLRLHLKTVRNLHEADLSAGFGDVYLPDARTQIPQRRDFLGLAVRVSRTDALGRPALRKGAQAPRLGGRIAARRTSRGSQGRPYQARELPYLSPLLCYASAGSGLRHPNRAGAAGTFRRAHHHDLHPCAESRRTRGEEPAGRELTRGLGNQDPLPLHSINHRF